MENDNVFFGWEYVPSDKENPIQWRGLEHNVRVPAGRCPGSNRILDPHASASDLLSPKDNRRTIVLVGGENCRKHTLVGPGLVWQPVGWLYMDDSGILGEGNLLRLDYRFPGATSGLAEERGCLIVRNLYRQVVDGDGKIKDQLCTLYVPRATRWMTNPDFRPKKPQSNRANDIDDVVTRLDSLSVEDSRALLQKLTDLFATRDGADPGTVAGSDGDGCPGAPIAAQLGDRGMSATARKLDRKGQAPEPLQTPKGLVRQPTPPPGKSNGTRGFVSSTLSQLRQISELNQSPSVPTYRRLRHISDDTPDEFNSQYLYYRVNPSIGNIGASGSDEIEADAPPGKVEEDNWDELFEESDKEEEGDSIDQTAQVKNPYLLTPEAISALDSYVRDPVTTEQYTHLANRLKRSLPRPALFLGIVYFIIASIFLDVQGVINANGGVVLNRHTAEVAEDYASGSMLSPVLQAASDPTSSDLRRQDVTIADLMRTPDFGILALDHAKGFLQFLLSTRLVRYVAWAYRFSGGERMLKRARRAFLGITWLPAWYQSTGDLLNDCVRYPTASLKTFCDIFSIVPEFRAQGSEVTDEMLSKFSDLLWPHLAEPKPTPMNRLSLRPSGEYTECGRYRYTGCHAFDDRLGEPSSKATSETLILEWRRPAHRSVSPNSENFSAFRDDDAEKEDGEVLDFSDTTYVSELPNSDDAWFFFSRRLFQYVGRRVAGVYVDDVNCPFVGSFQLAICVSGCLAEALAIGFSFSIAKTAVLRTLLTLGWYVGFTDDGRKVRIPDKKKCNEMKNYEIPSTVKRLRTYVAKVNYLGDTVRLWEKDKREKCFNDYMEMLQRACEDFKLFSLPDYQDAFYKTRELICEAVEHVEVDVDAAINFVESRGILKIFLDTCSRGSGCVGLQWQRHQWIFTRLFGGVSPEKGPSGGVNRVWLMKNKRFSKQAMQMHANSSTFMELAGLLWFCEKVLPSIPFLPLVLCFDCSSLNTKEIVALAASGSKSRRRSIANMCTKIMDSLARREIYRVQINGPTNVLADTASRDALGEQEDLTDGLEDLRDVISDIFKHVRDLDSPRERFRALESLHETESYPLDHPVFLDGLHFALCEADDLDILDDEVHLNPELVARKKKRGPANREPVAQQGDVSRVFLPKGQTCNFNVKVDRDTWWVDPTTKVTVEIHFSTSHHLYIPGLPIVCLASELEKGAAFTASSPLNDVRCSVSATIRELCFGEKIPGVCYSVTQELNEPVRSVGNGVPLGDVLYLDRLPTLCKDWQRHARLDLLSDTSEDGSGYLRLGPSSFLMYGHSSSDDFFSCRQEIINTFGHVPGPLYCDFGAAMPSDVCVPPTASDDLRRLAIGDTPRRWVCVFTSEVERTDADAIAAARLRHLEEPLEMPSSRGAEDNITGGASWEDIDKEIAERRKGMSTPLSDDALCDLIRTKDFGLGIITQAVVLKLFLCFRSALWAVGRPFPRVHLFKAFHRTKRNFSPKGMRKISLPERLEYILRFLIEESVHEKQTGNYFIPVFGLPYLLSAIFLAKRKLSALGRIILDAVQLNFAFLPCTYLNPGCQDIWKDLMSRIRVRVIGESRPRDPDRPVVVSPQLQAPLVSKIRGTKAEDKILNPYALPLNRWTVSMFRKCDAAWVRDGFGQPTMEERGDNIALTLPGVTQTWFKIGMDVDGADWYERMQRFIARAFGKDSTAHPRNRVFRLYKFLPPREKIISDEYFKYSKSFPFIHSTMELEWACGCPNYMVSDENSFYKTCICVCKKHDDSADDADPGPEHDIDPVDFAELLHPGSAWRESFAKLMQDLDSHFRQTDSTLVDLCWDEDGLFNRFEQFYANTYPGHSDSFDEFRAVKIEDCRPVRLGPVDKIFLAHYVLDGGWQLKRYGPSRVFPVSGGTDSVLWPKRAWKGHYILATRRYVVEQWRFGEAFLASLKDAQWNEYIGELAAVEARQRGIAGESALEFVKAEFRKRGKTCSVAKLTRYTEQASYYRTQNGLLQFFSAPQHRWLVCLTRRRQPLVHFPTGVTQKNVSILMAVIADSHGDAHHLPTSVYFDVIRRGFWIFGLLDACKIYISMCICCSVHDATVQNLGTVQRVEDYSSHIAVGLDFVICPKKGGGNKKVVGEFSGFATITDLKSGAAWGKAFLDLTATNAAVWFTDLMVSLKERWRIARADNFFREKFHESVVEILRNYGGRYRQLSKKFRTKNMPAVLARGNPGEACHKPLKRFLIMRLGWKPGDFREVDGALVHESVTTAQELAKQKPKVSPSKKEKKADDTPPDDEVEAGYDPSLWYDHFHAALADYDEICKQSVDGLSQLEGFKGRDAFAGTETDDRIEFDVVDTFHRNADQMAGKLRDYYLRKFASRTKHSERNNRREAEKRSNLAAYTRGDILMRLRDVEKKNIKKFLSRYIHSLWVVTQVNHASVVIERVDGFAHQYLNPTTYENVKQFPIDMSTLVAFLLSKGLEGPSLSKRLDELDSLGTLDKCYALERESCDFDTSFLRRSHDVPSSLSLTVDRLATLRATIREQIATFLKVDAGSLPADLVPNGSPNSYKWIDPVVTHTWAEIAIAIHFQPSKKGRRALFTPFNTGCPLPVPEISDRRFSFMIFAWDSPQDRVSCLEDNLRGKHPHLPMEQRWVGFTAFIRKSPPTPAPTDHLKIYHMSPPDVADDAPPGCVYISHNIDGLGASLNDPRRLAALKVFSKFRPMFLFFQETKVQACKVPVWEAALKQLFPYLKFSWNCSTIKLGYSGTLVGVHRSLCYDVSPVRLGPSEALLQAPNTEGRIQLAAPADRSDLRPAFVNIYDMNAKWGLTRISEKLRVWSPAFMRSIREIIEDQRPRPVVIIGDFNARLSSGAESLHPSFLHEAETTPSLTTNEFKAMTEGLSAHGMLRQSPDSSLNGTAHTFYPSDYERGKGMGISLDHCVSNSDHCFTPLLESLDPISLNLKLTSVTQQGDSDGVPSVSFTGTKLLLWNKRRDHQAMICVADGSKQIPFRSVEPLEEFAQRRTGRLDVPDS
jgi:exonuclease III